MQIFSQATITEALPPAVPGGGVSLTWIVETWQFMLDGIYNTFEVVFNVFSLPDWAISLLEFLGIDFPQEYSFMMLLFGAGIYLSIFMAVRYVVVFIIKLVA